ncbi:protein of unknown function [Pseudomonas sp. ok272]|uniref:DUF4123 domain-containing protein n=1 Tax=unclassified Pseudomonas TaxID=196821 RepID=UPI0008D143D9|nr:MULTISPECIES: DUF4123 domain-containing protein [unclassified Pseudomonas]SEM89240.1 protein of unknown function [Pseudomonas sp. ok272]SFM74058.1 protein of unknown function [Pseudomonas sp. ok602]
MSAVRSAQWVLLDIPGAPQVATQLQQAFAEARCLALFEGTDLHALRDQGPQLIDLAAHPVLAQCLHEQPQDWPGLLLETSVAPGPLLAHLRRMLTVTFGVHYKAVLSYYNPFIASYFFDACDARELSRWLGPVEKLYWYGGTWADRALGSQGWQQLVNPRLPVSPLAVDDNLSLRQQGKLQTCMLERRAWDWSRSTGHDYARIWSCVQEGLAHGFNESRVLDGWLRLRLRYPSGRLDESLPGDTQQEQLDSLRGRWQRDNP